MCSKKKQKPYDVLTFQITWKRKKRYLLFKTWFWGTASDPADPAEMEHKLRLATHQQRTGGQDDMSLNKLPRACLGKESDESFFAAIICLYPKGLLLAREGP